MAHPTLTDALAAVLAEHVTDLRWTLDGLGWGCDCGASDARSEATGPTEVLAEARRHVAERLVVAVSAWSGGG